MSPISRTPDFPNFPNHPTFRIPQSPGPPNLPNLLNLPMSQIFGAPQFPIRWLFRAFAPTAYSTSTICNDFSSSVFSLSLSSLPSFFLFLSAFLLPFYSFFLFILFFSFFSVFLLLPTRVPRRQLDPVPRGSIPPPSYLRPPRLADG